MGSYGVQDGSDCSPPASPPHTDYRCVPLSLAISFPFLLRNTHTPLNWSEVLLCLYCKIYFQLLAQRNPPDSTPWLLVLQRHEPVHEPPSPTFYFLKRWGQHVHWVKQSFYWKAAATDGHHGSWPVSSFLERRQWSRWTPFYRRLRTQSRPFSDNQLTCQSCTPNYTEL